jgi:hypothetical protein
VGINDKSFLISNLKLILKDTTVNQVQCVWGVLVGGGKGNEGDEGEGILLLMNFTYFYEI